MIQAAAYRPITADRPQSAEASLLDMAAAAGRIALRPSLFLPFAAVAISAFAILFALAHFSVPVAAIGEWAYLGVFLAEMVNSAVLFIPTPGPAYSAAMAVVLDPLWIGVIGGIGAALGEIVGYVLGATGRHALEGGRLYERFRSMAEGRFGIAIFAFAVLPVPFDIAGLWAGTVRYPIWRFLMYATAGKMLKIVLITMAVYHGYNALSGPFG